MLLTTFPHEPHGLGLLMAEGMLALEGATCIGLGTQTPVGDIVSAAASQRPDIVGISFSTAYPLNPAIRGLAELRARMPRAIEIWAGGANPGIARCPVPGVSAIPELASIPGEVARWRAARGGKRAARAPHA